MKYAMIAALLLAGCATVPDTPAPAPKHHLALKAPPMAVAAPAVPQAVPEPVTKPTARERALRALRFWDRAQ